MPLSLEHARVEAHIAALVDSAPEPTPEQLDRLRNLFSPLVKAVRKQATAG